VEAGFAPVPADLAELHAALRKPELR